MRVYYEPKPYANYSAPGGERMGEGKEKDAGSRRENQIQHLGVRSWSSAPPGRACRESWANDVERLLPRMGQNPRLRQPVGAAGKEQMGGVRKGSEADGGPQRSRRPLADQSSDVH